MLRCPRKSARSLKKQKSIQKLNKANYARYSRLELRTFNAIQQGMCLKGRITDYECDKAGRLELQTDAMGGVVNFRYGVEPTGVRNRFAKSCTAATNRDMQL